MVVVRNRKRMAAAVVSFRRFESEPSYSGSVREHFRVQS